MNIIMEHNEYNYLPNREGHPISDREVDLVMGFPMNLSEIGWSSVFGR